MKYSSGHQRIITVLGPRGAKYALNSMKQPREERGFPYGSCGLGLASRCQRPQPTESLQCSSELSVSHSHCRETFTWTDTLPKKKRYHSTPWNNRQGRNVKDPERVSLQTSLFSGLISRTTALTTVDSSSTQSPTGERWSTLWNNMKMPKQPIRGTTYIWRVRYSSPGNIHVEENVAAVVTSINIHHFLPQHPKPSQLPYQLMGKSQINPPLRSKRDEGISGNSQR